MPERTLPLPFRIDLCELILRPGRIPWERVEPMELACSCLACRCVVRIGWDGAACDFNAEDRTRILEELDRRFPDAPTQVFGFYLIGGLHHCRPKSIEYMRRWWNISNPECPW